MLKVPHQLVFVAHFARANVADTDQQGEKQTFIHINPLEKSTISEHANRITLSVP